MAIQDDVSNFFDRMLESGRQDAGRTDRAINVLPELDGRVRSSLEMYYQPEQYGSLEEAMRFDPSLVDRVMEAYDQQAGGLLDGATYPDATMPDTSGAVLPPRPDTSGAVPRPRPAPPINAGPDQAGMLMVGDYGSAAQGQGMDEIRDDVMSVLDFESLRDSNPDLAALREQAAIRMMEKQARQEGVYGSQAARLRAAAGEETNLSGRDLSVRTGRALTADDERNALEFGLLASTGAGNVVKGVAKTATAAKQAGGLRNLLQMLRRRIGADDLQAARQATQGQYPIGMGTRFKPSMQGPALNMNQANVRTQQMLDAARRAPGGYADGGRLRDNIMNTYGRM